jgi:uncharacterized membrane protein YgdD (TMEM256/DUF423 family)
MRNTLLFWAALIMVIAVACGAFGAHGLRGKITPEALGQWQTAVLYQMIHGLALFGLFLGKDRIAASSVKWSGRLFLIGVLCFSGSLYLLSTRELLGSQALTPVLGPVTPLGGLCFIGGWLVLAVPALRSRGPAPRA